MSSCIYEEVATNSRHGNAVSIFRQSLICSVVSIQFFMVGLNTGSPTVFIPQIRREANSTDIIDDELASWIYSTGGLAMCPWIIILPIACDRWGRKPLQLASSVFSTISYVVMYLSQTPYHIIIAFIISGFMNAGNATYRILTVVDYTSPKYRGIFLTFKSASAFWGIWVSNAIGTFFPWKYISVLGFICSIYTFIVLFWPESPFWLAKKGRFDECRVSYQWLHGRSAKIDKEIDEIILSARNERSTRNILWLKMYKSKEFYKPAVICVVLYIQYHFSGKFVCSLYILDIIKSIMGSESTAYTVMLILDGVTVFGMYFGSYLSKILKRRTLYFSSSFASVILACTISLYLFLVKLGMTDSDNYISLALFILYSLSICCGTLILALSISGEVIPSKFQVSCYIIIGVTYSIFYSPLIKTTPLIFTCFGIHGTFLLYGITSGICSIFLYFNMPETKNKTQLEIAKYFQDEKTIGKYEIEEGKKKERKPFIYNAPQLEIKT